MTKIEITELLEKIALGSTTEPAPTEEDEWEARRKPFHIE